MTVRGLDGVTVFVSVVSSRNDNNKGISILWGHEFSTASGTQ